MPLGRLNLWQRLFTRGHGEEDTRGDGVSFLVQIARGLSYIHYARVVHLGIKPYNVITFESAECCSCVQIADFGQAMAGPNSKCPARNIKSTLVNSSAYRPLQLFYMVGSEVAASYSFDKWAFGCVVFDVLQQHPRLRSRDDRALRLFEGVNKKSGLMEGIRVRNYRLTKHLEKVVVAVVVRFQPDRLSSHPMSVDCVRAVVDLHA